MVQPIAARILCQLLKMKNLRMIYFLLSNVDNCYRKFLQHHESPTPMLLRNHPLLSHRGLRSWPPHWNWTGGAKNMHPQGEVGILREVLNISPADRCFLHITYEASQYVGCLLIEDPTSCYQIAKFLHSCCNRSIAEIGSLDLHPYPSPLQSR